MQVATLPGHELPDFLVPFSGMHRAMRRDAARLGRVLGRGDAVDSGLPLLRWWTRFERVIVHHHEREDEVIWPELVRRSPEFADARTVLTEDHARLDQAMHQVAVALTLLARPVDDSALSRSADAACRFVQVLGEHLDREERAAFPLLGRCFTEAEYVELEDRIQQGSPLRDAVFELPWVLDGAPADVRAAVDEKVPAPMQLVNRLWWTPVYRRATRPVVRDTP